MTAQELRRLAFGSIRSLGYRPAGSLPMPDMDRQLRPPAEIAARLMALDAVVTWVCMTEEQAATERIEQYIARNRLRDWMPDDETVIIELLRAEAHTQHVDTIGWRMENMWALAWTLGFEPEPEFDAAQISDDVIQSMIYDFLPGLDASIDDLLAQTEPRSRDDVIEMEYFFYCAHNAVRSAQLGNLRAVPDGFHPVVHGGAIHERRHSLTWCLSPDTAWVETDLST